MNHLEQLIFEYYEWRGYVVRRNVKVGRRSKGGWGMELDVVAYKPETSDLVHIETSLDADTWEKREQRFKKKFDFGRQCIHVEVMPWLSKDILLKQEAILVSRGQRKEIAGARLRTVDEAIADIREFVQSVGLASSAAITEQYPLLRTIQMVVCGYYRKPKF